MPVERTTPQLVKKGKGKKRPGYRGPGGYQGGRSSSTSSGKSGNTGTGNRHNPHTSSGTSKTTTVSGNRMRSSARETQQAINNARAIEDARKAKREETLKNTTKFGYQKPKTKLGGLGSLIMSGLGMLMGIPGLGLLTGGLGKLGKGLGSLNDKIQSTDFARSTSLMDYLDAKKYGGIDARDRAASKNMREARAIQTAMDMRPTTLDPREMARTGLQTIDRPTQTFSFDNSGMTKETDNYTDADFTNEYGYPMTAGLLSNIGVRPTIGMETTPLGFSIPTGDVGLNASGRLGNLSATVDAINALKGESVNPQINYSGNFGNTNVFGNYSDDVQNLGLNFNNDRGLSGGISYDAITGEPRFDIGFRRTFADGGIASMFTRRG